MEGYIGHGAEVTGGEWVFAYVLLAIMAYLFVKSEIANWRGTSAALKVAGVAALAVMFPAVNATLILVVSVAFFYGMMRGH